jgi:Sulfotransferase family
MSNVPRIKVLYIAGYGRSGTTMMSIALGLHPSILGAGEITELSRHAWINNTHCSCGHPLRECSFWSAVVNNWLPARQTVALNDYRRRQEHFENLFVMQAMDFGIGRRADLGAYVSETEKLFRQIAAVSGKNIIVDSSKMPSRVRALARMKDVDLYVVHMVRDGRGVAWSLMKGYKRDVRAGLQRELVPKSALRTGIRWTTVNLAAEQLRHIVGPDRYVRVRYEDFVANPAEAMKTIGGMIGCDLQGVAERLARGEPIETYHQMAGNRLRMSAAIKMEKDEAWRSQMPETTRRQFEWIFGRFLARYNYA